MTAAPKLRSRTKNYLGLDGWGARNAWSAGVSAIPLDFAQDGQPFDSKRRGVSYRNRDLKERENAKMADGAVIVRRMSLRTEFRR
jgi:hypothetical protein